MNEDDIERKVVRFMLQTLATAGWLPYGVDDGGDDLERCETETEMMEAIFNVADSVAYFTDGDTTECVVLACGNGLEIICDHSMKRESFTNTMNSIDEQINEWEEEK